MVAIPLIILMTLSCITQYGKPRISIITSLYKGDDFIKGFMEDITRQTIFEKKDDLGNYHCELLLINAHSPHNEEVVIKPYLEKHPNIIYKRLDHDPGIYAVWNYAIEISQGDYISNANVDDRLVSESLQTHMEYLDNHQEIDIVYCNNYWTPNPNESFEERALKREELGATLDNNGILWNTKLPFSPQALISGLAVGHHPMWRKSLHDRLGFFDTSFKSAADWDMWCRAFIGGAQFFRMPEFLGSYYANPQGLSSSQEDQSRIHSEARVIYEKYKNIIS